MNVNKHIVVIFMNKEKGLQLKLLVFPRIAEGSEERRK